MKEYNNQPKKRAQTKENIQQGYKIYNNSRS